MKTTNTVLESLRREARYAPDSGIIDMIVYGREKPGLIPLWAGEGDLPTPQFICDAATQALADGQTFYTYQRGIPPLRQALADYHEKFYGRAFPAERFLITGSGMQAIQIAVQAIAGAGDEVIVPTPTWPNIAGSLDIIGARPVEVPMQFAETGWSLDFDRIKAAIGPRTRALFLNSPGNPTGWVADDQELQTLLTLARDNRIWIIADEVYGRFVYDRNACAPSLYDIAEDDDLILYVNSFSKNWAMTGWRIGWISAPPVLAQIIENLIQYSTSGVAEFSQRAALVALQQGEEFLSHQLARARDGRRIVCDALRSSGRAQFAEPAGAFYMFFRVDGEPDSVRLARRLVDEANIGLAPGTAFGAGGDGFVRLCFARSSDSLQQAVDRLVAWLNQQDE